jgi:hypothetical protein
MLEAAALSAAQLAAVQREAAAMAIPAAPQYAVPPMTHKAYYGYIGRCRAQAKARGQRVVAYKTFHDWCSAVANAQPTESEA